MIQTLKHQLQNSVGPTLAETQSNDMLSLNVRGSKLSAKSVRHNIPVQEMLQSSMKNTYNLSKPQYGVKHYICKDNMQREPYFKINAIAVNKKDKKGDNFVDEHVAKMKWVPGAKYDMIYDWSNNFGKRGKFLKGPKVTFIDEVITQEKKKKPKPHCYPIQEKLTGFAKAYVQKKESCAKKEKICEFIEQAKW